jgi:hypothetical protein
VQWATNDHSQQAISCLKVLQGVYYVQGVDG